MGRLIENKTLKNLEISCSQLTSFRICNVLVGGVFVVINVYLITVFSNGLYDTQNNFAVVIQPALQLQVSEN